MDSAIGRYTTFEQLGPGDIVIFLCFTPKGKYGFKDFFFCSKKFKSLKLMLFRRIKKEALLLALAKSTYNRHFLQCIPYTEQNTMIALQ